MSYFAKFLLTGPDAAKAVDWIFTNNMRKPPGKYFFYSFPTNWVTIEKLGTLLIQIIFSFNN